MIQGCDILSVYLILSKFLYDLIASRRNISLALFRTMSTHRARKRIREAKRKARPELATSDMWVAKDFLNRFDLSYQKVNDTLERIDQNEVSEEEFVKRLFNSIGISGEYTFVV